MDLPFYLLQNKAKWEKKYDPKLTQIFPCFGLPQITSSFALPSEIPAYSSLYFLLPSVKTKNFPSLALWAKKCKQDLSTMLIKGNSYLLLSLNLADII